MKITTKTTYIGSDGRIADEKQRERDIYFEVVLPRMRQIATIECVGDGHKITITRLEEDKN